VLGPVDAGISTGEGGGEDSAHRERGKNEEEEEEEEEEEGERENTPSFANTHAPPLNTFNSSITSSSSTFSLRALNIKVEEDGLAVPPPTGLGFPDLSSRHKVSLELVRMYPEFLLGASWADARTRLAQKGLALTPANAAVLEEAQATAHSHGLRVAGLQRMHADAWKRAEAAKEASEIDKVTANKAALETAAVFEATNRRRPWVTQGKRYIGPTLEERQLAAKARDSMVATSFRGAQPLK